MSQGIWTVSDEQALINAQDFVEQLQAKKLAASKRRYSSQIAEIRAEQRLKETKRKESEKEAEKAAKKAAAEARAAAALAERVRKAAAARAAYARAPRLKINGRRGGVQVIPSGVLSGRIGKNFPETRNVQSRGFPAGRNRCYRNSVLQCVLHTPEFYHLLGNIHKDCVYRTDECVTCALQFMAKIYWEGQGGKEELALRSRDLGDAIGRVFTDRKDEDVVNLEQSDPFDLMTNFARYIQKDVTGRDPEYFDEPPIKDAEIDSNEFSVESVFNFDFEVSWKCEHCGDVKPPIPMSSFGMSISMFDTPDGDTIESYIESKSLSPFLDTGPFVCETEACLASALKPGYVVPEQTKIRWIRRAPEILVARLRRAIDDDNIVKDKVVYDEYLDLSEFSLSEERIMYRLRGIVDHVGSTRSGHYTSEVLCRPTWENPGPFYCRLDENSVGWPTYDAGELLDPAGTDVYVLVYSREPNDE